MGGGASYNFMKYYNILDIIGNGAFGMVFKGREIKTNELRAIKVIKLDELKGSIIAYNDEKEDSEKKFQTCIDGFIQECENMKACSNINSVKFYEYFQEKNIFVIIMELCDCNLSQLLLKNNGGFDEKEIYEIMKQLNNAFKVMKENKIIHRDLKPENILIKYEDNNKYIIKLSDYGSSKRLNSLTQNYCNSKKGTLIYMAPELLKGEKPIYNYKCDLWSIGIILYRLKFFSYPFSGHTEFALMQNINIFGNNLLKKSGNKELDDLIKKLLEKDYEKRLNWDEYFNHPFFHKLSNKINLIYYKNKEILDRDNNIFGEEFVENNKII